jgi:hypothetical protein
LHGLGPALACGALLVALAPNGVRAQPTRSELPMFLTEADRAALRSRLATRVVTVARTVPPPVGTTAPIPDRRAGAGLCLGNGRVLTAASLVADWPLVGRAGGVAADVIEVRLPGEAAPRSAAVGYIDAALGIAVLDVRAPIDPATATCAAVADPPPGDGDVGLGVVLYTSLEGRAALAEVAVRGPGQGPLAWYSVAAGDALPAGTPLFSGRGTFVTLVGEANAGGPGLVGVLPARAVRALWDERFRWDP